jgi:transposase InsO family protein
MALERLHATLAEGSSRRPGGRSSDNGHGVPFASPNGLYNLSKRSVWWLRLGIAIERIKPGHPQQNGRHERMHRTLKQEATRHIALTKPSSDMS